MCVRVDFLRLMLADGFTAGYIVLTYTCWTRCVLTGLPQ